MARENTSLVPVRITLDDRARQRIQQWIAGSGAPQADLAIRIGRTAGWLSRYLHGDFDADLETLQAIAAAFGLPFVALFDDPGESPVEAKLIQDWRMLPPDSRAMLSDLADLWARPLRRNRRGAGKRR